MLRPPSTLTRALRALVALVTVWCLGCSAFEPLLDHLAGAPAGSEMICASDTGIGERVEGSLPSAVPDAGLQARLTSSDVPAESHAYECGCQSCHAVQLAFVAVAPATPALPARLQTLEPTTPPSVSREPLVPPPQRDL
jgi:hypothetical protein